MSVGVPMYFLWRLNVICAPGWRSPGMGRIGCYINWSIGAPIDWGIMSWAVNVHVCVVVLDSPQLGDPGRPTGWVASGSWGTRGVLKDSKVGERFKIESKVEKRIKSRKANQKSKSESKVKKRIKSQKANQKSKSESKVKKRIKSQKANQKSKSESKVESGQWGAECECSWKVWFKTPVSSGMGAVTVLCPSTPWGMVMALALQGCDATKWQIGHQIPVVGCRITPQSPSK